MTRRARSGGLTLLELMVALAIAVVLLSIAVPSYSSWLQRQRLKSAAHALEADLKEARFEAAKRKGALHVVFAPGPDWCYAIATAPDCDCRSAAPCRLKAVLARDAKGVRLEQSAAAVIGPLPDPSAGRVTVAQWAIPQGERVRVELTPLGRPLVCAAEGSLGGMTAC